MNQSDAIPMMLVVLFGCVVCLSVTMMWLFLRLRRQTLNLHQASQTHHSFIPLTNRRQFYPHYNSRPPMWMVVRSRNPEQVQAALELEDPTPCSWIECMNGEHTLFITPPVNGWIFVVGAGLPVPGDDVDVCFRFLTAMSRKLGHVQFFQADSILHHHAWGRFESGRVVRAYAWGGTTLWNQGLKTSAEIEMGLKCLAYDAEFDMSIFGGPDWPSINVDKVPQLAARWSLDPATVGGRILTQVHGIAGRPSRLY